MRHEHAVQTRTENSTAAQRKDVHKQATPADTGSNWQFKILMVIIGCGVLMLVLKTLGVL
jgi:hypothetical protein